MKCVNFHELFLLIIDVSINSSNDTVFEETAPTTVSAELLSAHEVSNHSSSSTLISEDPTENVPISENKESKTKSLNQRSGQEKLRSNKQLNVLMSS